MTRGEALEEIRAAVAAIGRTAPAQSTAEVLEAITRTHSAAWARLRQPHKPDEYKEQ